MPSSHSIRFAAVGAAVVLLAIALTALALHSGGTGPAFKAEPAAYRTAVTTATPQPPAESTGSFQTTPPSGSAAPTAQPSIESAILVTERFSGGRLPRGWSPVRGTWKIVDGRLQATTGDARARIAFGPQTPKNYRIETLVRFVRVADARRWLNIGLDYHVKEDRGALFVARSDTTATNGLELAQRSDPDERYRSKPISDAPLAIGVGEDHSLTIEVHGRRVEASVDGQRTFSASNLARTGGGFGFVINNSTVQFDDVTVTRLDE